MTVLPVRSLSLGLLLLLAVTTTTAFASDWSSWRGPHANGVADADQRPVTTWSATKNILWKAQVPGRGHSSPTVHGNRIYLATADEGSQVQGVIALNREDGKQVWITKLSSGGLPKTHIKNTHATSTVACDGERLFIAFHHHNKVTLHALNVAGKELWSKDVGPYQPRKFEYGYAPSPLLYGGAVIIAADIGQGGYLTSYRREDGRRLWRQERPHGYSFSSPIVAHIAGKDQLLMSGCSRVSSYDPTTGKPLWNVAGTTMATCGTMVWDGDAVFASGGYPDPETIAVKADGSKTVLWKNRQKCYEQSMLAHDGHIYALTDKGIAYCWRAIDGQEQWKQRLAGPVSASPILVGETIYVTNEAGKTFVFKANPRQYEAVAQNQLGSEGFATPTIVDSRIYLRTATGSGRNRQEVLYCIGDD